MSNDMMEQFMKNSINFDGLNADIKHLLTLKLLSPQKLLDADVTRKKIPRKVAQAAVFYGVPALTTVLQNNTLVTGKDASS